MTQQQLWLDVLAKIGGYGALVLLSVGGAWKAFQHFSGKWLDNRFAEKLKAVEQKHDVMVRHLQSSIDRELDRARKLQDREFEALSKAWGILHETFWRTREATNRAYTVVDLSAMQDDQLEEFVTNLDFPGWRKKDMFEMIHNGAGDETIQKYYEKGWRTKQHSECQKWRVKFVQYIDRKGIFMQPEIKERFDKMQQLIADALLEFELRIRDIDAPVNRYDEHTRSDALRASENGLYAELETMIRERLWSPVKAQ
jgi:hypothetical protein